MLSVSNWRTIRSRLAPIANRIATSRRRAAAFANNRLATFAHAISRTAPTTALRSAAIDRERLSNGAGRHRRARTSATVGRPARLARVGPVLGPRAPPVSACACSRDTPALSRATMASQPLFRLRSRSGSMIARIAGTRRTHPGLHHHRRVDVQPDPNFRARKVCCGHADDREGLSVQPHVMADDVGASAERVLPEAVADHQPRDARRECGRRPGVSNRPRAGCDAKRLEEVARDDGTPTPDPFRRRR